MKHRLLVTALLAGLGHQAAAQAAPVAPISSPTRQAAAPVDSAAVLHQLFRHSRRVGLLGLAATTGITAGMNALNDPRQGRQIIGVVAVGANTGLLVLMLVDRLKYSHRREREAIERLEQHQPLRPYVQRSYALALLKTTLPRR